MQLSKIQIIHLSLALGLLASSPYALAENKNANGKKNSEELEIERIKQEFGQISSKSTPNKATSLPNSNSAGFTADDSELDAQRAKLLAAEKALLKEMATDDQKLKKANLKSEPVVTRDTSIAIPTTKLPVAEIQPTKTLPDREESSFGEKSYGAKVSPAQSEHLQQISDQAQAIEQSSRTTNNTELNDISQTTVEAKKANLAALKAAGEQSSPEQSNLPPVLTQKVEHEITPIQQASSSVNTTSDGDPEAKLETLRKINAALQNELKTTRSKLAALEHQSEQYNAKLLIAETEVDRLAGMLRERNDKALIRYGGKTQDTQVVANNLKQPPVVKTAAVSQSNQYISPAYSAPRNPSKPKVNIAEMVSRKEEEDMQVATVVAEKANLRTGPGMDNSPLMSVSKGTRLAIETRSGDWYRVIAPTGNRAWVSSDVLAFGGSALSSPTRTVRIKGFDSKVEDEAFHTQTGVALR